jgi:uncharacterized protein
MAPDVLEELIKEYLKLAFNVAAFAWQGGEPTLMGIDFFEKAVQLQKKHAAPGTQISNTMQTNGVLIDDKWCRFLHENKFLIGISIDGPKKFHDYYRLDHSGSGTFDRVIRTIENFKKYKVEFNALILLNNNNVDYPDELFDFLVANGIKFMQFIPCIETDPTTGNVAEFSITPDQYGRFLCKIFDRWYDHGSEKLNIREIDSLISYFVLGSHTICTYNKHCGGFVVVEHSGDCFCCEFFVGPDWHLGNILQTPLEKLATAPLNRTFARLKLNLSNKCLLCRHLAVCRSGCLKDRVPRDPNQAQESYFCESYQRFFDHAIGRAKQIAADITAGATARRTRPADKVRLKVPTE